MKLEDFKTKEHYKQYLLEKSLLLECIECSYWEDTGKSFLDYKESLQEQVGKELEEYDNIQ